MRTPSRATPSAPTLNPRRSHAAGSSPRMICTEASVTFAIMGRISTPTDTAPPPAQPAEPEPPGGRGRHRALAT